MRLFHTLCEQHPRYAPANEVIAAEEDSRAGHIDLDSAADHALRELLWSDTCHLLPLMHRSALSASLMKTLASIRHEKVIRLVVA